MTPRSIPAIPAPWISLGAALVLGLGGCASKDSVLPRDLPSMQSIYQAHFQGLGETRQAIVTAQPPRPVRAGAADLDGWLRSAADEIEARFPTVPNPTLVLYVFPHLGPHGVPVPGYTTAFPMYETVEYALPGEVVP